MTVRLRDIASVIRSKNAGPFELTLDVLLKDSETFEKLRKADVINAKTIAKLYCIPESDVIGIVYFSVIAVTFFLSYRIVFREGAFDWAKTLFAKIKGLFRKKTSNTVEKEDK